MTNEEKAAFFAMLDKYKMNPMIIPTCPSPPRDRILEEKSDLIVPITIEKNLND